MFLPPWNPQVRQKCDDALPGQNLKWKSKKKVGQNFLLRNSSHKAVDWQVNFQLIWDLDYYPFSLRQKLRCQFWIALSFKLWTTWLKTLSLVSCLKFIEHLTSTANFLFSVATDQPLHALLWRASERANERRPICRQVCIATGRPANRQVVILR